MPNSYHLGTRSEALVLGVVLALGTTGALDWFAPAQPWLAVISIVLLALALRQRLTSSAYCAVKSGSTAAEGREIGRAHV